MYNKTIIRFGFCDIQNNQGLGKGYQPQPSASADNPYLDLDYSGYHKTSSNNCLLSTRAINTPSTMGGREGRGGVAWGSALAREFRGSPLALARRLGTNQKKNMAEELSRVRPEHKFDEGALQDYLMRNLPGFPRNHGDGLFYSTGLCYFM